MAGITLFQGLTKGTGLTRFAGLTGDAGLVGTGGSGAPPPSPYGLRIIGTGGYIPTDNDYVSGYTRSERRGRVLLGGQSVQSIRFLFWNGYITSGEQGGSDTITVESALEMSTPASTVMMTFGGAANVSIAPGAYALSDPIYARSFGLSVFPANADMFSRTGCILPNTSAKVPYRAGTGETITGQSTCFSSSASSQISATGALVTPSGGISNGTTDSGALYPAAIIGEWAGTPDISVLGNGDSIMEGVGDNISTGGFFNRGLNSVSGRRIPYINASKQGEQVAHYANGTKTFRQYLMGFSTHLLDETGVNDVAFTAAATTITRMQAMWADFRTYGSATGQKYVARTLLSTEASSTDSYATLANQTPLTGFAASGIRDAMNTSILALLGASNGPDEILHFDLDWTDTGTPNKWPVTGAANYATTDGVHPTTALATLAATRLTTRSAFWSVSPPLRAAAVYNPMPNQNSKSSRAACDFLSFRSPYRLAGDMNSLAVVLTNFYIGTAGQVNTGNAFTINQMSLEYNGAYVPLTFGGSRTKSMANGDFDQASDQILPSAFSLTKFPAGAIIWIRGTAQLPAVGNFMPCSPYFQDQVGGVTPQNLWYTSATTITNIDGTGTLTSSGTAPTNQITQYMPLLVGRPTVDRTSILVIGDSITEYYNDGTNANGYGRGYFQRSMRSATSTALIASINFAQSGTVSTTFTGSNTKWLSYLKYVNAGHIALGTNDFGTSLSFATFQPRIDAVIANFTGNGITNNRLTIQKLGPRVVFPSSPANYVDEAGQTVFTVDWDTGGSVETTNTYFDTLVTNGTLYHAFNNNATRGVDTHKWIVTGASNYATSDGTHPSDVTHEFRAVEIRPIFRQLF